MNCGLKPNLKDLKQTENEDNQNEIEHNLQDIKQDNNLKDLKQGPPKNA